MYMYPYLVIKYYTCMWTEGTSVMCLMRQCHGTAGAKKNYT